jgi:hypothetical protein
VLERIIDGTLFWPAFMLIEIRLKLLFGLISVRYKFPSGPECQLANVAICGVRSAPDKSDDSEPPVWHDNINNYRP